MKKSLLLILIIFLPLALQAQKFEGGFFGGLSMSQVDGDNYAGYRKPGLTAGGYILRPVSREIDFRLELRFIQKGSFKPSTEMNPVYYKVSLQYIELPLLIQYTFRKNIFFSAGLSPDVLLHSKEEDENGALPSELHPKFRRFSAGANLDASYGLTENFILGARFTYSFLPVREHAGGATYLYNLGWYNNSLSLTGYYQF